MLWSSSLGGGDGREQSSLAPPSSGLRGELALGAKVFFVSLLLFQNNMYADWTRGFWDCRPHFSSSANKLFYLGDTRERGSKRRSREGRGNSPPSPAFASPPACLSRVYFSHGIPQMESLLAGYVFPRYFTGMRVNTQKCQLHVYTRAELFKAGLR